MFGDSDKDRRGARDDKERDVGRELEDLRFLLHEFKHLFKEIQVASQDTVKALQDATAANDQARARLIAATDKLISIITSTPTAPPDDEAAVTGVIGEIKSFTDALNAEAQKAEDAAAAAGNGGTKPPVVVPAPTLSSTVAADGTATITADVDASAVTQVKFASNATDFPTKADVEAASAITVAPFTFVPPESPLASGSATFVGAIALDPDGNESDLVTLQVENGDSGVSPLSRTVGGPRISPK